MCRIFFTYLKRAELHEFGEFLKPNRPVVAKNIARSAMKLVVNSGSKVASCNLRAAISLRNQRIQRRVFGEMLLLGEFGEPEVEDGAGVHDKGWLV